MKTIYNKPFRAIATILDRIVYVFKMYPTKNPNSSNWLYQHRIKSSAYPDGSHYEYINGISINDIDRNKVSC